MSDTARTSSRGWWLLAFLALVILVIALAWTRPSQSSTWEATAVIGTEAFEINRDRIPRTAAALVRGSSAEFGESVRARPIEGTGLLSIAASGDTREEAESAVERFLPVVIHDLNRAGADVGTFVLVAGVASRPSPSKHTRANTLLFGFVGLSSLSLSANRFRAFRRVDGSSPRD
jgi:hypothetical protein